ncbi:MAG: response regulator [Polyangiales bacterium]
MATDRAHILVVDDDPDALSLARGVLSQAGWRVSVADTVADALAVARRDPPQCVVSDVMMPGEDGFALLEVLRAEQPDVPVILMTGYGGLDDAVRAVSSGAERYLPKPARPGALRDAVRTASPAPRRPARRTRGRRRRRCRPKPWWAAAPRSCRSTRPSRARPTPSRRC